ncbi:MAG TPA: hypothetical protein VLA39_02240 [Marinobacterium sp.]|nr:hypothetical protein [Marinobacterium sp.]
MNQTDPHRLNGIKRVLGLLLSALFVVLGVLGYRQTGDILQLALFIAVALIAVGVVQLLFALIERVLNSLDNENR